MNHQLQWIKLAEQIHYDSGYVFCNIIDPALINHLNFDKKNSPLVFFIICDQDDNQLLIFDNTNGFSFDEIKSLSNFYQGENDQYHAYFRSLIKLGDSFEFINQNASEEVGYYFTLKKKDNQLEFNDLKQTERGEYYYRTKFSNGTLVRIKKLKKSYELDESKVIANRLKLIYQKFINTNKLEIFILHKKNEEFYDLAGSNPAKINSFDKAKPLAKTKKPVLATLKNGKNRLIVDKIIEWNDKNIYVNGYVGILKDPDFKRAGLYLYNNNKLIKGISYYERYRPELLFGDINHLNNQYIYGEIELSNIDVGISNDIFEYDAKFEKRLLKYLISLIGDQRCNQEDKISGWVKNLDKQKDTDENNSNKEKTKELNSTDESTSSENKKES
ncbi:hypothetical protein [Mycoplasma bradburyae]|uniref:Uncharacterized protein n=1 Tax=Mycoplasma bradburyae TaxID=2963128 RepID=A0AAW6HQ18_9MOLU|nr:hypothetical protein [Mycoplasma bradburyae]MDC4163655.1 hypothetical protein [Mycoplasma bradburyae]MDC4182263.1 hypothetical protein [Mycoplasma bradburyae]MDC4182756.1 hypothetical protein [Mycoplasma bradburyae]MDC4183429.1 hypothetical protein [Mycoplasma bradburyae]MDC4184437.1 hypothetical protein [Mycoplasma bradburyae]